MREEHITSGRAICGYLPVSFHRSEIICHENSRRISDNFTGTKTSRPEFLKALQESIELGLRPLADCALQGMKYTSLDRESILFLCVLSSSVANLPECEDMLSVKCGTRNPSPCQNC